MARRRCRHRDPVLRCAFRAMTNVRAKVLFWLTWCFPALAGLLLGRPHPEFGLGQAGAAARLGPRGRRYRPQDRLGRQGHQGRRPRRRRRPGRRLRQVPCLRHQQRELLPEAGQHLQRPEPRRQDLPGWLRDRDPRAAAVRLQGPGQPPARGCRPDGLRWSHRLLADAPLRRQAGHQARCCRSRWSR